MKTSNRNSKLQVTLNQWVAIKNKEMGYIKHLRKQDVIDQADQMIEKIKGMME